MIITLIALVILMIGGVTLVRSFDTSMVMSGNLAFKRDLVNQGERGIAQAIALLKTGALSTEATRQNNLGSSNYSATALNSDAHGVPLALFNSDSTFASTYTAADTVDATANVTIRYIIDRQCSAAGAVSTDNCMTIATDADASGSNFLKKAGGGVRPVYRISVRVTGPRNAQAFLQSTVAL